MYSNYEVTSKIQKIRKKKRFYFKTTDSMVTKICIRLLEDYKLRGNEIQDDMYSNYNVTPKIRKEHLNPSWKDLHRVRMTFRLWP